MQKQFTTAMADLENQSSFIEHLGKRFTPPDGVTREAAIKAGRISTRVSAIERIIGEDTVKPKWFRILMNIGKLVANVIVLIRLIRN